MNAPLHRRLSLSFLPRCSFWASCPGLRRMSILRLVSTEDAPTQREGSFDSSAQRTLFESAPFAGPFAEIGRQTFDGRGNTDATATLSANGNIVKG